MKSTSPQSSIYVCQLDGTIDDPRKMLGHTFNSIMHKCIFDIGFFISSSIFLQQVFTDLISMSIQQNFNLSLDFLRKTPKSSKIGKQSAAECIEGSRLLFCSLIGTASKIIVGFKQKKMAQGPLVVLQNEMEGMIDETKELIVLQFTKIQEKQTYQSEIDELDRQFTKARLVNVARFYNCFKSRQILKTKQGSRRKIRKQGH